MMMIERSTPMYKETLSLIMTLSEYSLFLLLLFMWMVSEHDDKIYI